MSIHTHNSFIIFLFLVLFGSISSAKDTTITPTQTYKENYNHTTFIGKYKFKTELAITQKEHQKGMMFRPNISDNELMLFIFTEETLQNFWMKNTLVALDMLYFDKNKTLVEIKENIPPCKANPCKIYTTKSDKIQFVAEIKAGVIKKLNIKLGSKLNYNKLKIITGVKN